MNKSDFEIGDKVICTFPDKCVYPIFVGHIYTITNVKYQNFPDSNHGCWEYEIENYKKQIYDEYEFSAYFKKYNLTS